MSVGCAFTGNLFFVISLFYWMSGGKVEYAFGIIGVGLVFQYYYDVWSRWAWRLLK